MVFLRKWSSLESLLRARFAPLAGEDAGDLTQEVFLRVYRHRDRIRSGALVAYVSLAARSVAVDYVRRVSRAAEPLVEEPEYYRSVVQPFLDRLPLAEREAVVAYCTRDSFAEAARDAGVPYSTFRYEAYERAALDEYLKNAKSEEELRELLASLIERRSLLRDFEVAKLREEAATLLEKLHENSHRKLVEELSAFKDVLALSNGPVSVWPKPLGGPVN